MNPATKQSAKIWDALSLRWSIGQYARLGRTTTLHYYAIVNPKATIVRACATLSCTVYGA